MQKAYSSKYFNLYLLLLLLYSGFIFNICEAAGNTETEILFSDEHVEIPEETPRFDITISKRVLHNVFGFGVQIQQDDDRAEQVIKDLKLKYVRVEIGPTWMYLEERLKSNAGQDEVNEYVERNFNIDFANRLSNAQRIWRLSKKYDFKIILNFFDIPYDWRYRSKGSKYLFLKKKNVKIFGKLWLGIINYLNKNGLKPDYLELANEPDGNWNGGIFPEQYDELIRFVRHGLDLQNLESVSIIGPGLTNLEKDEKTEMQFAALSENGVDSLSAWSTHTWDEWHQQDEDYSHNLMRAQWEKFRSIAIEKDKQLEKPIFVTEYSSASIKYFGEKLSMYKQEDVPLAVDTHSYARRVYQNTLINMNYGANVQIIWSAAGQDWDDKYNGLISKPSEGSKKRPMYGSLMTLIPYIPSMSEVLESAYEEEMDLVISTVRAGKKLVLGISNPMPYDQIADIDLSEFKIKNIEKSIKHQFDVIDSAQMNIKSKGDKLEARIPADTTTTIVISLL